MSTELELKFALPEAFLSNLSQLLPDLAQIKAERSFNLLNAYFDTPTRWFRLHDMGLRSRQKDGCFEQTIKLAGKQHGAMQLRPEYNLPCTGVTPDLVAFDTSIWPEDADVAALQSQLTELFRTDFARRSWLLQCPDGSEVELVYDSGEVRAGSHREAIAELELEFVSGNPSQLFVLAQQLINKLPLRTGFLSKAARGYLLAASAKPQLSQPASDNLASLLQGLQQAELCFDRTASKQALAAAATILQQLSQHLTRLQLVDSALGASVLAERLAANDNIFVLPDYNLLLLALTRHLLFADNGEHQHDN